MLWRKRCNCLKQPVLTRCCCRNPDLCHQNWKGRRWSIPFATRLSMRSINSSGKKGFRNWGFSKKVPWCCWKNTLRPWPYSNSQGCKGLLYQVYPLHPLARFWGCSRKARWRWGLRDYHLTTLKKCFGQRWSSKAFMKLTWTSSTSHSTRNMDVMVDLLWWILHIQSLPDSSAFALMVKAWAKMLKFWLFIPLHNRILRQAIVIWDGLAGHHCATSTSGMKCASNNSEPDVLGSK